MLDLRHIHLGQHNIASFANKRDASALARARGYYQNDVIKCFNRFCIFWTVAQYSTDGWHIAKKDGGFTVITIP